LYPSVALPEFKVMTTNELFGMFFSRFLARADEFNSPNDVVVFPEDVGAILLHVGNVWRWARGLSRGNPSFASFPLPQEFVDGIQGPKSSNLTITRVSHQSLAIKSDSPSPARI
jgi:hypothetical protein